MSCLIIPPVHLLLCNIRHSTESHPHPILLRPNSQHHLPQPLLQFETPSFRLLHLFSGSFSPDFPHSSGFLQNLPFLPKVGQSRDGSLQRRMFDKMCTCICASARVFAGGGHEVRRNDALGEGSDEKDGSNNSHPQQNPQFPNSPAMESVP